MRSGAQIVHGTALCVRIVKCNVGGKITARKAHRDNNPPMPHPRADCNHLGFVRDLAVQLASHDHLKRLDVALVPTSAPDLMHPRRGATHRGEHRQAAGAAAQGLTSCGRARCGGSHASFDNFPSIYRPRR